jgi:uncharacterized membrane protein
MTRKLDRNDAVGLALLALAAAATIAVYPRLPSPMPTHFDAHGDANGWMPKPVGAFLPLAIAAALWALLRFGGALLPRPWRERQEKSPMGAVALLTLALFAALQLAVLRASLAPEQRIGSVPWVLLGLSFMALGQVLPRVRRNPWVGVRTTWTLTSDENWARTHRFASYAMTVGGFVAMAAGLAGAAALAIAAIVASVAAPAVYSWVLARRLPPGS